MKKHENNGFPMSSVVGFLGLVAVVIAIGIGKETGVIEHDVAKRGVGIILGLMLIGAGNLLPKFRLFDAPGRDPAQTLAAERFAGWVFVITGTAYVIIWAFAPMSSVMLVSSIVGLSSFALVAFDWIRRAIAKKPSTARRQATVATVVKRTLLGTMLVGVGWGSALFLIDHIWGDTGSQWAAVIFPIVLALLVALGPRWLATGHPLDN
jgi:hypothetical protein